MMAGMTRYRVQTPYPHDGKYGPGWTDIWGRDWMRDDYIVIQEIFVEDVYRVRGLDKESWTERPVVDLGANIGAFSLLALAYDACKVIAVEPHPDNFKVLAENFQNHPRADRTWPMQLAAAHPSGMQCSLFGEQGEAHLAAGDGIQVETISLGDLLPNGRVAFVKCDIEGGEYNLFLHAGDDVVSRIDRIAMEWHGLGMAPHLGADAAEHFGKLCAKLARTHTLDIIGSPDKGGMLFAHSYTADE